MEYVVGGLALFFVLVVVLGIIATVKTVRAVKRGVSRTGRQLRQTVEETTLKARAAQPGPVGELARIRVELRSSLDSTRAALTAGLRTDPSLKEALGLLDRLQDHARQLDGELRMLMAGEPDRGRIAAQLPQARSRAERIRHSADSLRWAAQDRARSLDEEGLAALDTQIEIETGALRDWRGGGAGGPAAAGTAATRQGTADGGTARAPDRGAGTPPEESDGGRGDVTEPGGGTTITHRGRNVTPSGDDLTPPRPAPPSLPGRSSTSAGATVPGLSGGLTGVPGLEPDAASPEALAAEPASPKQPRPAPGEGR